MAKFKVVTGIVLRHIEYGEAEKLFILLSPTGKVKAFAKGVRKVSSKNAGHLELFSHAHIQLVEGNSNRFIIGSALAIDKFDTLAYHIEKFAIAMLACEYIDIVATENDDNAYHRLLLILKYLKEQDYNVNTILFVLAHLSVIAGVQPSIELCAECGETTTPDDVFYSVEQGGVVCQYCHSTVSAQTLNLHTIKILRNVYRNMSKPIEHQLQINSIQFVAKLMYTQITHMLDKPLKTWKMIEDVVLK
jgi:DNA repair protein RecO (recombination protein O)